MMHMDRIWVCQRSHRSCETTAPRSGYSLGKEDAKIDIDLPNEKLHFVEGCRMKYCFVDLRLSSRMLQC